MLNNKDQYAIKTNHIISQRLVAGIKNEQKEIIDYQNSDKLLEFGILPGVSFHVLQKAPFGGPIFIEIEGYKIAVRKEEAAYIIVEE